MIKLVQLSLSTFLSPVAECVQSHTRSKQGFTFDPVVMGLFFNPYIGNMSNRSDILATGNLSDVFGEKYSVVL